jgi:ribosomal protein S12 methylthiotransferase
MKGAHRSRTVESIVSEIAALPEAVREVNLIGQDTAAFGWDRSKSFELPRLLDEVAGLGKIPWLRLLYAHPGHVTDAMIDAIARHPSICKYVDFPVEHTHDAMLTRMNRGVTRRAMESALMKLRRAIPGIQVRTTIIVGFPQETDEEFRDLMDTLRDWRFERLGAFIFSDEEGARAHQLPGHLPDAVKRERRDAVLEQQSEISADILKGFVGKKIRVLVEEKDAAGVYVGRSEGDAPEVDGQVFVHSSEKLPIGEFVDAEITESLEYDLVGRAV